MCLLCIGYDYTAFMDYMDPDVPKKADKLNLSLSFARAVLYAALLFPLSTTRVAVIVDWAHSVAAVISAVISSKLFWTLPAGNPWICSDQISVGHKWWPLLIPNP